MINIFIDTNIFIRMLSQSNETDDRQFFSELKVLIDSEIARALLPEIVLLELEKQNRNFQNDIKREYGNIKKNLHIEGIWSEIKDTGEKIIKLIESEKRNKLEQWEYQYINLVDFLNSDCVIKIQFTPEIMCNAQKRIISGNVKCSDKKIDQDIFIMESLIMFFKSSHEDNSEFLFCSENIKDFAEDNHCLNGKQEGIKLDANYRNNLPDCKYFTNLQSLIHYINYGVEDFQYNHHQYSVQHKLEELDVLDKLNETERKKYEQEQQAQLFEELIKEFLENENKIGNEYIRDTRKKLIEEILNLLLNCRKLSSWDDKSELKLASRLEMVEEELIPYTKLSNLMVIKNNLKEYYNTHLNMI